jgi:hypothetical protein
VVFIAKYRAPIPELGDRAMPLIIQCIHGANDVTSKSTTRVTSEPSKPMENTWLRVMTLVTVWDVNL